MRDDHGHFGRYKQALYFARLLIEQLEEQERTDSEAAQPFARQRVQCFFESAVIQLVRSFCSLVCVAMPPEKTAAVLASPTTVQQALQSSAAEHPSASLKTLCQALLVTPDGVASSTVEPLGQLLEVFDTLWLGEPTGVASVDPGLIQSSNRQRGSLECRDWHRQLQQLGDDIVNLQTES